ncbi:hypothetical protein SCHPADRAFT_909526 [Schizopora paradoxa]|uniref:Phytanoyl-CoA dioxygenase n=1 Tax=Schizopora paradoxa TaxID=27342 RepID=A0A0H2RD38_9AGAM|nr:hypothetical protein SCHPADRAFT_909526 [Schizopora paradoxa]
MSTLKESYERDGFVLVPNLISPNQLSELRAACARVVKKTRRGDWPHRRVVGKQFPPYGDTNPDSWGVQHVMHPALDEPAFVRWYTSDAVVDVVEQLLECEEGALQMELFNLLINPERHSFALRWHRDDIKETATTEEETEALGKWHYGVQWNTALYEDSCLFVVPGSHKVPRTPEQRALSETPEAPKNPLDMPGAIQVTLQPGETVFYNSNILHCATYDARAQRATLHPCMGDAVHGGMVRARNILQHGIVDWVVSDAFKKTLTTERANKMRERLLEMARMADEKGVDVGYSLDG